MHEISVVVAMESDARTVAALLGDSRPVRTRTPWWLVPLTRIRIPDLEDPGEVLRLGGALAPVTTRLCGLALEASVALAFTQHFGGRGSQGAVVIAERNVVFGPEAFEGAINEALRLLGAAASGDEDLFEAIGLDQWRSMEDLAGAG